MIKKFFFNRLKEPSTWRGLTLLATIAGVSLSPEQKEAIITAGVALTALIGVFAPDKTTAPDTAKDATVTGVEIPGSPKSNNP